MTEAVAALLLVALALNPSLALAALLAVADALPPSLVAAALLVVEDALHLNLALALHPDPDPPLARERSVIPLIVKTAVTEEETSLNQDLDLALLPSLLVPLNPLLDLLLNLPLVVREVLLEKIKLYVQETNLKPPKQYLHKNLFPSLLFVQHQKKTLKIKTRPFFSWTNVFQLLETTVKSKTSLDLHVFCTTDRLRCSYPFQSLKLIAKTTTAAGNNAIKSSPLATQDAVSAVESVLKRIDTSAIDFTVKRKASGIPSAGLGAYLHGSTQKKGSIVCFYPGTLYMPSEPILFVSISNQYILKCVDGIYVDGKPRGLSKRVYKSLFRRENWPGAIQISDWTWMNEDDTKLSNPLAIGQYANNSTSTHKANVCYQEIDLPTTFPHKLRRLVPNMYWDAYHNPLSGDMRVVALVALRDIRDGEELFSTYMDIV